MIVAPGPSKLTRPHDVAVLGNKRDVHLLRCVEIGELRLTKGLIPVVTPPPVAMGPGFRAVRGHALAEAHRLVARLAFQEGDIDQAQLEAALRDAFSIEAEGDSDQVVSPAEWWSATDLELAVSRMRRNARRGFFLLPYGFGALGVTGVLLGEAIHSVQWPLIAPGIAWLGLVGTAVWAARRSWQWWLAGERPQLCVVVGDGSARLGRLL